MYIYTYIYIYNIYRYIYLYIYLSIYLSISIYQSIYIYIYIYLSIFVSIYLYTCRVRRDCAEAAAASRDSAPREESGTEYSRLVSDPAVSRASAQIVTCSGSAKAGDVQFAAVAKVRAIGAGSAPEAV